MQITLAQLIEAAHIALRFNFPNASMIGVDYGDNRFPSGAVDRVFTVYVGFVGRPNISVCNGCLKTAVVAALTQGGNNTPELSALGTTDIRAERFHSN